MKKVLPNIQPEESLSRLFKEFFDSEKAGGILLVLCTIVSIVLANSNFQETYFKIWTVNIGNLDLQHWINDGLMAVFFLLIGLELEREIYIGELSSVRKTLLPVSAAIGGMLVPALIYLLLNFGTDTQSGFGIPMATDIAFAIGVLSLLGSRVPLSLKVFLTALAIVDDLGAIVIIALFYTDTIIVANLIIALSIFGLLILFNRFRFNNLIPYIIGGIGMWYFLSHSGVHASISGVLLAFSIPFNKKDAESPSYKIQHFLHKPVAFIVLPLFALANTAIDISGNLKYVVTQISSLGILAGLVIGKPTGILLFGLLAVKLKMCELPQKVRWRHIAGISSLAGIGFTMSIFITLLAFENKEAINSAKLAILLASLISGSAGFLMLKLFFRNNGNEETG